MYGGEGNGIQLDDVAPWCPTLQSSHALTFFTSLMIHHVYNLALSILLQF